jgi:predicted Zn-dependent protease
MRLKFAATFAAGVVLSGSCGLLPGAHAADLPAGATPMLGALRAEVDRSFAAFKVQPVPAFYLGYEVTANHRYEIETSFGALMKSTEIRDRHLDIDVRIGSPQLDNTHELRGDDTAAKSPGAGPLPIEDDPDAIRATIWRETDQRYKAAVEQLARVKSNVVRMVADEDKSGDFAAAPAAVFIEKPAELSLDRAAWEQRLRRYTAPFASHGDILAASATLVVEAKTRWQANSEGTLLQTVETGARLQINATTRVDDGMTLPLHETFFALTPEKLPADAEVFARIEQMIANLAALRRAPVLEAYLGPAILSGRAAGVFFHEVFGHRVEGQRLKRAGDGQTFKKVLGQRLLPETLSVYGDPTLEQVGSTALGGHYVFDDEAVKAQRVALIEAGVFKGFLMSRAPVDGFPRSNGHGRKMVGAPAVARQSNLVVAAAKPVSRAALKQELLKLIAEQKKPYGLFVDDIESGFAITDRTLPNAFNVTPVMIRRIFPDGREELVRGVNLIGTPLVAFSRIVAADDSPEVFNGMCGAESGWVPVSAVSPGLLLSQVEVQKQEKSQERLPLLLPPTESPPVARPPTS